MSTPVSSTCDCQSHANHLPPYQPRPEGETTERMNTGGSEYTIGSDGSTRTYGTLHHTPAVGSTHTFVRIIQPDTDVSMSDAEAVLANTLLHGSTGTGQSEPIEVLPDTRGTNDRGRELATHGGLEPTELCNQLLDNNERLSNENRTYETAIGELTGVAENAGRVESASGFGYLRSFIPGGRPHPEDAPPTTFPPTALRELDKLRRDLDKARRDLNYANNTLEGIKRAHRQDQQRLNDEKKKNAKLEEQLDKRQGALTSAERTIKELQRKLEDQEQRSYRLNEELNATRTRFDEITRIKQNIAGQLNIMSEENQRVKTKLQQTETLMESRMAELRLAETYLNKYDNVAGEDVVALVQEINLKILDIAATVSEGVTLQSGARTAPPLSQREMERVASTAGQKLDRYLRKKDHSQDPTFVQLAIQTTLVKFSEAFLVSWPIPQNSSLGPGFWDVFEHMRRHGMFYLLRVRLHPLIVLFRATSYCVTLAFVDV